MNRELRNKYPGSRTMAQCLLAPCFSAGKVIAITEFRSPAGRHKNIPRAEPKIARTELILPVRYELPYTGARMASRAAVKSLPSASCASVVSFSSWLVR